MGCWEAACRQLGCGCDHRMEKDEDDKVTKRFSTITSVGRSCTDVPCIIIFILFLFAMAFGIWTVAFSEGDPDRLTHGVNHQGLICGKSPGVEHLPYAFWPDFTEIRFQVCTDDCNTATNDATGNLMTVAYNSEPYLDTYCVPEAASGIVVVGFDSATAVAERNVGDLKVSLPVFGIAFGLAFVAALLYVWLMKLCIGVLVWGIVALIIIMGGSLGYFLFGLSNQDDLTNTEYKARRWTAYFLFGFTFIFFVIVVSARDRIKVAIEVIKSAGRAIHDMPMMVFFPIPMMLVFVGFFFLWTYAALFIFSAGVFQDNGTPTALIEQTFAAENHEFRAAATYKVLNYTATIKRAFTPHLFLLFWVSQTTIYFIYTVIAGATSDWYFTERDEDGEKYRGDNKDQLPNNAVTVSCQRTCRFHLGSVIFAACIIAVIKMLRAALNYLERTLGKDAEEPNALQKVLFRVVDCALWCLECCMDKVSQNALIWVSIYGDAFCPSICGSWKLLWANLMRVAFISMFSALVMLLGKVLIPLLTTAVCGLLLVAVEPFKSEVSSPFLPLFLCFLISYGIAEMFLTVYDTVIDTVFLCFLVDEEHNGREHAMFADEELREIVQNYEEQSKAMAARKQKRKQSASSSTKTDSDDTDSDSDESDDSGKKKKKSSSEESSTDESSTKKKKEKSDSSSKYASSSSS